MARRKGKRRRRAPAGLMALLGLAICLAGCAARTPIEIGLAAELTGSRADSGIDLRDGAQLAIETINARGGVAGQPLRLVVRDEQGDPAVARQTAAEFIQGDVVAVVGAMTSGQTAAMWEPMNHAGVVLLSPTSSSDEFTGQADYLFRVMPANSYFGRSLAEHIYNERGVRRLTGIYDLSNRAFAENLWHVVRDRFEALGGDAGQSFTFTTGQTDLADLMAQVVASQPEAVVFIASAVDTALMVQYSRQTGLDVPLFSSTWAQTNDLLSKGGQAVEGLEISAVYDPDNPHPNFQDFLMRFEARYGREPSYPAVFAYEAVLVLADALERTSGRADGLAEALVAVDNLEVVQGRISIDAYGDVRRDVYVAVVKDGAFEIINTIRPAD
jgi:branched-chain amino acid transport system substrate-binding protein